MKKVHVGNMYCHSNQYVIYLSDFFLADWAITFLFTRLEEFKKSVPNKKQGGKTGQPIGDSGQRE